MWLLRDWLAAFSPFIRSWRKIHRPGVGGGGSGELGHFGTKLSQVGKEEKKLFSAVREETLVSF